MNNREKLKELLKEMFRFGDSELDFGIYRIMNQKREQINEFIEEELDQKLIEETDKLRQSKQNKYEQELEEIKANAEELGVDYKETDRYKEIKNKLDIEDHLEDIEAEIYKDIYTFFKRYYDNGDFISQRRYSKENKYAIPYNGEEVYLYWANQDQYYIKTSEEFDNYSFDKNGVEVNFKVDQAQIDKNNNKSDEDRYFLLKEDDYFEFNEENKILNIYFEYRNLTENEEDEYNTRNTQKDIRNKIYDKLKKKITKQIDNIYDLNWLITKENKTKSELESHLYKYTTKNKRDYFIHKNLQDFLERELDFYIKNEIIDIDNISTEKEFKNNHLGKVRIIKSICQKIIKFLAQIENFQKKLFNKKKFVLENEYCLTLDKVPEGIRDEVYEEILNNKKQLKEWEELYNEKIKKKSDLYLEQSDLFNDESLKNLAIDTKYFNEKFKERLLNYFDDIENALDGLIINSENYQALKLLKDRFENEIDYIYIDPPYNTKNNAILYKNNYKHASWLSLMNDRIDIARKYLKDNAIFSCAIDDTEQRELGILFEQKFPNMDLHCITVVHNPRGIQGKNFSYTHEYVYYLIPSQEDLLYRKRIPKEEWNYSNLRNWGGESRREHGNKTFYPIYVDKKTKEVIGTGEVPDEDFHPSGANVEKKKIIEIWPIDSNGIERKWRYSADSLESFEKHIKVVKGQNGELNLQIPKKTERYTTVWNKKKFDSSVYGKQVLTNIVPNLDFSFPKSIHTVKENISSTTKEKKDALIFDFFAGSGTTAHATLSLNQSDNGSRKYILTEMSNKFVKVTIKRLKRLMYSRKWSKGKPEKDNEGYSHIFKYQSLEQYEDTLENIFFKDEEQISFSEQYEDYMLNYMLDYETKDSLLDIDKFAEPFSYKIKAIENKEEECKKVNLVETFNYLIGLEVNKIRVFNKQDRKYKIVKGKKDHNDILIVWRNTVDLDLEEDRDYIQSEIIGEDNYDKVYINGDNFVPNSILIEKVFKNKMFEDTEEDLLGGAN